MLLLKDWFEALTSIAAFTLSPIYGMQKVAENVTGIKVPNSGHWIPEEQPKFLIEQLTKFFNK